MRNRVKARDLKIPNASFASRNIQILPIYGRLKGPMSRP